MLVITLSENYYGCITRLAQVLGSIVGVRGVLGAAGDGRRILPVAPEAEGFAIKPLRKPQPGRVSDPDRAGFRRTQEVTPPVGKRPAVRRD